MKRTMVLALSLVLMLALAAPAFAVNGSSGAGSGFGTHHAEHAIGMSGFTADMNPGKHQGFAGWMAE